MSITKRPARQVSSPPVTVASLRQIAETLDQIKQRQQRFPRILEAALRRIPDARQMKQLRSGGPATESVKDAE